MEKNKLKSITDNLNKFDHLHSDSDIITITEWSNGEGWDISINEKMLSLTYGELSAIRYLIDVLNYEKFD